jgi:Putative exonuclease SbcCD, C subunit/P-loop containing region of AAA domain
MSVRAPLSAPRNKLGANGNGRVPERAWIRRIRLINWHGHENALFEAAGDMLAFIGENGSGKSLVLDAIDWALFPAPNKQFNAAAREGSRTNRRTLSNTILFFDPHGVERPDRGWRRQRTVGYCAVEVEHEGEGPWVYGSAAAATPHAAHPWYYALPTGLDRVAFLDVTAHGQVPLQMPEFRDRNGGLVAVGGAIFNASQAEDYNRLVARRLLNIEGADWQRRYDALYDVLHRMLGLKVDEALVADPSGVVRQFLPVVDRPHLERLVEGLESIQRIHRDIEEYAKLRATLAGVVDARQRYHEAVLHHAGLIWLRTAWAADDAGQALAAADQAQRDAESVARQAEADEERAYADETAARRELDALQQLHQGDIVQAVTRANEGLETARHEHDRAARELRQADERLQRSDAWLSAAQQSIAQEEQEAAARLAELRERAQAALGGLPAALVAAWERVAGAAGDEGAADALHATWTTVDGELAALAAHVARLDERAAALAAALQAERTAQAQHDALTQSVQTARQALWARWDRMVQRWPEGIGTTPAGEPSTMVLPSLVESSQQQLDVTHAEVREHSAHAARLAVTLDDLEAQLKTVEAELAQAQREPPAPLTKERAHALTLLRGVDATAVPLYQTVDLAQEATPWADAIEALLGHADALTLLALNISIEQARAALGEAVDWHSVATGPAGGRAGRGTVAAALATTSPTARRYLDEVFGACVLAQEPARSGDYLCPDGRYRLGAVAGRVRPIGRAQALIGSVRRQAAAAARREELTRERTRLLQEMQETRAAAEHAQTQIAAAEERARGVGELIHMLDEVEQRRGEMRTLKLAEEKAGKLARDAARAAEEAAEIEEAERARWTERIATYPRLADPARLPAARTALAQAVADSAARVAEARGRLLHLQIRLRTAEETRGAESEVYGMVRAHTQQAGAAVEEAQRLLDQARSALRAAGLENVEARITQLQRRLKEAEERARQLGVAKGVALHQLESSRQARAVQAEAMAAAGKLLAERNAAFELLMRAVADSLELPASQLDDPVRYARQLTKDRNSRNRLDDDLPRAFSQAEREQEGFVAAVGEYQTLVGSDDRFGLRAPAKHELSLAPQGWLLNVTPRLEGTSDVRLLLSFLDASIEQLQQTLSQRVTRVVRDIILGEVVSHLVDQLVRAHEIIVGLNERLATARFFARNTRYSLRLAVRLTRHPDIPFDHVAVATALLEHGRAMPASVQAQLTQIFSTWLDEQMRGQAQPSVEALVEQLDYRRWVDISLLHSDDLDPRIRPWDSAVSGFGSGGEQRVPVYVLLLTAAAMQFAVSHAPLRLLMHDEAFARMDQRNADLVVRFAQQLGVGLVIASPNLDLFAEGVSYASAYRLRQLPNGHIAREALHLSVAPTPDKDDSQGASG